MYFNWGVGMFGGGDLVKEDCWSLDVGGDEHVLKKDYCFLGAGEEELVERS